MSNQSEPKSKPGSTLMTASVIMIIYAAILLIVIDLKNIHSGIHFFSLLSGGVVSIIALVTGLFGIGVALIKHGGKQSEMLNWIFVLALALGALIAIIKGQLDSPVVIIRYLSGFVIALIYYIGTLKVRSVRKDDKKKEAPVSAEVEDVKAEEPDAKGTKER